MPMWRRKQESNGAGSPSYALRGGGDGGRIPKGYVPMVFVSGGGGAETDERKLVHVRMLKEPRMAALLETAAQQFGYGQRGVLRIPCDAHEFRRIACKAR